MKLGLGTVQFGMNYGVSNRKGQTSLEEAQEILSTAAESGITVLDTASLYGDSEKVLGLLLPKDHYFHITTKLPGLVPQDGSAFDPSEATRMLNHSLKLLQQESVYGLILHRADDLLSNDGDAIMRWLQSIKSLGLTVKIGISVYAEERIEDIIHRYPIELIQAPVSLFDQRLIQNGILRRCKGQGIEVHARSVFLQGLLCMKPQEMPAYFEPYKDQIERFHRFLLQQELEPIEAALSFVNEQEDIDTFLCGVNHQEQLLQLIAYLQHSRKKHNYSHLASSEPELLNPSLWQLTGER